MFRVHTSGFAFGDLFWCFSMRRVSAMLDFCSEFRGVPLLLFVIAFYLVGQGLSDRLQAQGVARNPITESIGGYP